jgi:hypothetical protein
MKGKAVINPELAFRKRGTPLSNLFATTIPLYKNELHMPYLHNEQSSLFGYVI